MANLHSEDEIIDSIERLRELVGVPHEAVVKKTIDHIDEHVRNYLAKCPLFFMATANAEGLCDVSPRGDQPGFVQVLDEHTLAFPERMGNRRVDSMINLLSNPRLGMICILPGMDEVLRINGRAQMIRNEALLQSMALNGRQPQFAVKVTVEECFIHCPRALKSSDVWKTESWLERTELPNVQRIFEDHITRNGYVISKDAE
ncbi:MSMEG_1061 family FMN-dependent PPOX-type flavoprotein [Paenibacillus montanisoli]|uniref:Pyridoxamine 5'-phosphate oxidase family protein n=1 Tax=Paenibacillus montanisoli TaxID=2081970 RepID=A0A328TT51_9BACL|nr:MSMEG_1061 family FMN-dependent PPOX-type flavoprotein [Paenibacillus montanisoli]RAP73769.1 pyridoxamine 5'-phosphate oxidase family protein [Paenibacillus montanisoli]